MQGVRGRKANYPRRVAPSKDEQQGAAHAAYMARMAAHFAEVIAHSVGLKLAARATLCRSSSGFVLYNTV